ncbi:MAG TPA: hypothetical protein DCZ01_03995 [Elusimicrobia bacterium]|nr:MAG: hypothetical protein A2X37_12525 [Elusimicrobia bacterium GWA2_66_18]OGR69853.1 MAG: hypothetical protein A2X40_07430 [Elusimicrobia bacterium GWC2_65_9]HAZ07686.1 hypothetical protein [Elusimicrobiota bacterium]
MAKMKAAKVARAKRSKARKVSEDPGETKERRTAEQVMETVLMETRVEAETVRLDQWVPIECPHCGEGTELHVIADMDGQSIDGDCTVCCRSYVAHVEIEESEAHVGVEAA